MASVAHSLTAPASAYAPSQFFPRAKRLARQLLILTTIALVVRTFIVEPSIVPTCSMESTILVGDHLLLNKFAYGPEIPFTDFRLPALKSVHRGEIVVFHFPKDPRMLFVKRAVAVGGDEVEIRQGKLLVNGTLVREPYAVHRFAGAELFDNLAPFHLAKNELFVLGDNRDLSDDSRFWGALPARNVIAEPMLVFWSYDAPTRQWLDEDPSHRLSFYGSIFRHVFAQTRWDRTATWL